MSARKKKGSSTKTARAAARPDDLEPVLRQLRILVVEDDPVDLMTLQRALEKSRLNPIVEHAPDIAAGLAALRKRSYDLLLLDHLLPDGRSMDMLYGLRNLGLRLPIVVTTGYGDEMLVVDLLRTGASDYLPKDKINADNVARAISHAIRVYKAEEELRKQDNLLQGVAEAATLLHTHADRLTVVNEALAILGKATSADRTSVFEHGRHPETGEPVMSHRYEWVRESGDFHFNEPSLQKVTYASLGLERWHMALEGGHVIGGPVKDFPAAEKNVFEKEGIRSLLVVPVFVESRLWGFVRIEDRHAERTWTDTERTILTTMASAIGSALMHRRADEALRESEARFRNLVERIPAITYTAALDRHSTTLYVSPQIETLLGYSPADYAANPDIWHRRLHPDDRQRVLNCLERARQAGQAFDSEYRMVARDGRVVWFRDQGTFVRDLGGKPILLQGIMYDITARREAEEALQRSEEQHRSFIENVNVGVFRTSFSNPGRFLRANPAHARILGYDGAAELMKVSVRSLYQDPDERDRLLAALRAEGHVHNMAIHLRRKDGMSITAAVTATLHRDSDGEPDWIDGVLEDITQRERTEEALRESERRFREFAEMMPQTVFEMDLEGRLTFVNRHAYETWGYEPEDVAAGRITCFDMIRPEDHDMARQNIRKRFEGDLEDHEYIARRGDGTMFPVIMYSAPVFRDGEPAGLRGIAVDVTDRKLAEEALRESEERYRTLAEASPDMIWVTDCDGVVRYANSIAARQFNLTAGQIVGKRQEELFPEDVGARHAAIIREVCRGGELYATEVPEMMQHTKVWIDTRLVPLRDPQDKVTGVLGISRDITQRKKMEEARAKFATTLLDVQEKERKEISSMLHDHLGQLLTLTRLELGSLATQDENSDRSVRRAVERLDEALQSVRRLAVSLRPPILDDLGIEAALESLTEEFADRAEAEISFTRKGTVPPLDKEKETCLYRVLQEALTNAVRHAEAGRVDVSLEPTDGEVRLRIRDDGRGFDTDPSQPAAGTGMVGMRERLIRCGGHLEVQSAPGRGTTITACLPAGITPAGRA